MRAGGRVLQELDQAIGHVVGDDPGKTSGLQMHPAPPEPDDVDEQALRQPVPADDPKGRSPTLLREHDVAAGSLYVAAGSEALQHLGHRRFGLAEPPGDTGGDDGAALLGEPTDRLEVVVDRRV